MLKDPIRCAKLPSCLKILKDPIRCAKLLSCLKILKDLNSRLVVIDIVMYGIAPPQEKQHALRTKFPGK